MSVGFTKKTYGVKGELKMKIEDKYLEDFLKSEVVFLKVGGKTVPFFLDGVRVGNALLAKFEDVDSPEDALPITSKEVFLREKDLIKEEEREFVVETEDLEFQKYEGFEIESKAHGLIGKIEEILEYPQQEMALVKYNKKEILIPMNEQLIEEVLEAERKLIMNLPEGLLEL